MARPIDGRRATRRQHELADKLRAAGVPKGYSLRIVLEAQARDLNVSDLAGVIEQETGFRNVFGCDHGEGRAFCHESVTALRVRKLLEGGLANGVGPMQLTSFGYVREAQRDGGAHKTSVNIATGASILAGMIQRQGRMKGFGSYNGGEGNPNMTYARQVARRAARFHRALT